MIAIFDATSGSRVRAWLVEDGVVLGQKETKQTRQSSGFFLPALEILLKRAKRKQAGITGVFVAEGAASFTTVRIAAVVANTLAYGLDIPVQGSFYPRTFTKKDITGVEREFERRKDYRDSYAPQYNHAPNITKPKLVC